MNYILLLCAHPFIMIQTDSASMANTKERYFFVGNTNVKRTLCFLFLFQNSKWSTFCLFFFRYAVVTGSNKGIGLETVKRLASNGVKVVLTARNQKRGIQAFEKLKKDFGFSCNLVVFHQLDVTDPFSISSLVEFVKTQFGRLDILVRRISFTFLLVFCFLLSKTMHVNLISLFNFILWFWIYTGLVNLVKVLRIFCNYCHNISF